MWVKPWLEKIINLGFYDMQVQELRFEDKLEYKNLIKELTSHKHLSPSQVSINDSVLIEFAIVKMVCEV